MTGIEDPVASTLAGVPMSATARLEEVIRPFGSAANSLSFVSDGGRVQLTYRELAEQCTIAGNELRDRGVRPGAMVATTIRTDLRSVVAVLGTWMAGATLLSVPPPTKRAWDWYARQFGPVLATARCRFVLCDDDDDALAAAVPGARPITKDALVRRGPKVTGFPELAVPDIALVQFTSGSVGTPKGVAIGSATLAAHLNALSSFYEYDRASDRIASWLPLYHDMGLIAMFLSGLAQRVDQVLMPPFDFAARPASWLSLLSQERATITASPNAGFRIAAAPAYAADLDLSAVRLAVCGGERVNWQTLETFQRVAGPMGFPWEALTPGYGLAEGTVGVSSTPVGRGPVLGPDGHVSVGKPFPGVRVRAPHAPDPAGPVYLGGNSLFRGYYTACGFERATSNGWIDTGDAGFTAGNELYIIGRRDEVLPLGGRNIFAEDIEMVAQESGGEMVGSCAAFRNSLIPDRFGLFVEVHPRKVKSSAAATELGRLIQSAVMGIIGTRPSPLLVVRLGSVPRTTSGKVQRGRCRTAYDSGEINDKVIVALS